MDKDTYEELENKSFLSLNNFNGNISKEGISANMITKNKFEEFHYHTLFYLNFYTALYIDLKINEQANDYNIISFTNTINNLNIKIDTSTIYNNNSPMSSISSNIFTFKTNYITTTRNLNTEYNNLNKKDYFELGSSNLLVASSTTTYLNNITNGFDITNGYNRNNIKNFQNTTYFKFILTEIFNQKPENILGFLIYKKLYFNIILYNINIQYYILNLFINSSVTFTTDKLNSCETGTEDALCATNFNKIKNYIIYNKQNIDILNTKHFTKNNFLQNKNKYIEKINTLNNLKDEYVKIQDKLNISTKLYNQQYKNYNSIKNYAIYIIIILIIILISIIIISIFPLFNNNTKHAIYIILLIVLIVITYLYYTNFKYITLYEKFFDKSTEQATATFITNLDNTITKLVEIETLYDSNYAKIIELKNSFVNLSNNVNSLSPILSYSGTETDTAFNTNDIYITNLETYALQIISGATLITEAEALAEDIFNSNKVQYETIIATANRDGATDSEKSAGYGAQKSLNVLTSTKDNNLSSFKTKINSSKLNSVYTFILNLKNKINEIILYETSFTAKTELNTYISTLKSYKSIIEDCFTNIETIKTNMIIIIIEIFKIKKYKANVVDRTKIDYKSTNLGALKSSITNITSTNPISALLTLITNINTSLTQKSLITTIKTNFSTYSTTYYTSSSTIFNLALDSGIPITNIATDINANINKDILKIFYNKLIPHINEYSNSYNDLLNNLRLNVYTVGNQTFSRDSDIYLYNLYLDKKKQIEFNNIKLTNLFNMIEVIKKQINYLFNIIFVIACFMIILLTSLLIYLSAPHLYIFVIILCVVLISILMVYFTFALIQPTRMIANKNYWASIRPTSKTISKL